jgi:5-methylcytosine-specific restriction protein B
MILHSKNGDINYWQIAPGQGARLWPDLLKNSIAAVGFAKMDVDLTGKPEHELMVLFKEKYPEASDRKRKIHLNQLQNFIKLKPGDKIITNQGKSKLLGVGRVVSGYKFQPHRQEYKHTVGVEYYKTAEKEIPLPEDFKGKFGRTILELTKNEFETMEKLFNGGKMDFESIRYPLNQILCGPPGTGKTYQTINYAIAIIENKNLNEINNEELVKGRNYILDKFNHYKSEGQIEFITFHQNYAYEDFIQGLRPGLESGGKSLVFELKDGVFKKIADIALDNYKASRKGAQAEDHKPPFAMVFNSFFQKLFEGEQETVEIPMKRVSYKITDITEKSIFFVKHSGGTGHTLSINTLSEYYDQEKVTMKAGLRIYYKPLLRKLIEHSKTISSDESGENLKNHVIIIDEINRANISRVFGELITLIESDKRYGQTNELKTTLPSLETFSVPPNLFIIGTMNTADKSIALLDIALRRRFEFIKIYPDSSLVISDFRELFGKMNQQIIKRKGPDFQIGHAYFMENAHQRFQIKDVMDKKVIPLLYEYFMNDGEAVNEILKSAGVLTIENSGLYEFESLKNKKSE